MVLNLPPNVIVNCRYWVHKMCFVHTLGHSHESLYNWVTAVWMRTVPQRAVTPTPPHPLTLWHAFLVFPSIFFLFFEHICTCAGAKQQDTDQSSHHLCSCNRFEAVKWHIMRATGMCYIFKVATKISSRHCLFNTVIRNVSWGPNLLRMISKGSCT